MDLFVLALVAVLGKPGPVGEQSDCVVTYVLGLAFRPMYIKSKG